MKRTIRLTESDLHKIIKESVKRIIKEGTDEVKLPGLNRSMHGFSDVSKGEWSDPSARNDWNALSIVRNQRAKEALANRDFAAYGKNIANANRNAKNAYDMDPSKNRIMAMNGTPNPLQSKVDYMLRLHPVSEWTNEELQWALEQIETNMPRGSFNRGWSREQKQEIISQLEGELEQRGLPRYGKSPADRGPSWYEKNKLGKKKSYYDFDDDDDFDDFSLSSIR